MKNVFKYLIWIVLSVVAMGGFSAMIMLLWNWLMPAIFGLTVISFWQTVGLLILLAGLSKFVAISTFTGGWGYKHNPVHEKWLKMTPEERKEFIRKRHHYGFGHDFFNQADQNEKQD